MQNKHKNITLEQICKQFGVADVYELRELHLKYDQKAIKEEFFDENNGSLLINQVKDALLDVNLNSLEEHERNVVQNMLWLWYHHATTVAIWGKHDILHARKLCKKALKYLYPTHPNKITPMICMLLSGDIDDARKWNDEEVGEVEKEYALHLLDEYEKGAFIN